MALPNTGQISASMINLELGKLSSAPFSLNAPDVRALAQKPTGQVKFSDFYGKSSEIFETVTLGAVHSPAGSIDIKGASYWADRIGCEVDRYFPAAYGSVAPATFRGITIRALTEIHGTEGDSTAGTYRVDSFQFSLGTEAVTSTFLKKIKIFLGATLVLEFQASAASFLVASGANLTSWTWALPATWYLVAGNNYTVRLIYE